MSEMSPITTPAETSSESRLNTLIAIVVSIAATMVAVFNIKDNNIVQAMSQAQAHSIDSWSYFQAKSIKQHLVENTMENLQLRLETDRNLDEEGKKSVMKLLEVHKGKVEKYEKDKAELKAKAEGYQAEYDTLNLHDDQFDLAEALISLGLSIFGITALTRKWPLFVFGLCFCLVGAFFGIAGFLGMSVHPEWITRILG